MFLSHQASFVPSLNWYLDTTFWPIEEGAGWRDKEATEVLAPGLTDHKTLWRNRLSGSECPGYIHYCSALKELNLYF